MLLCQGEFFIIFDLGHFGPQGAVFIYHRRYLSDNFFLIAYLQCLLRNSSVKPRKIGYPISSDLPTLLYPILSDFREPTYPPNHRISYVNGPFSKKIQILLFSHLTNFFFKVKQCTEVRIDEFWSGHIFLGKKSHLFKI